MRILIIEDEFNIADAVATRLKKENYSVDIISDGQDGLYQAESNIYDLVILDIMLPHIDGFEILKTLREENVTSKIIMLTAKSTIEDKLQGLNNGADDYLTKPFHIDELVARINIQLKGNGTVKKNTIEYSDLSLNTFNLQLTCLTSQKIVELVRKEFQLLEYFFYNSQQVLTKEQIYDKVWGFENEIESNNLEVYLTFIRRKFKAIGSKVNIKAVRGLGYRLEVEDEKTKK